MASRPTPLARIGTSLSPSEWLRCGAMAAVILGLHLAGWAMLLAAVGGHFRITSTQVFGVGTGVLAYTLGLRHAFDADHIAAIDNTTRRLLHQKRRPLSVGFFFSLGHSSVVFAVAVLLNFGIRGLDGKIRNGSSTLQGTVGLVGTVVSAAFLLFIAALNAGSLRGIVGLVGALREGRYSEAELEHELDHRGFLMRVLGPLARRVDRPSKMYPIGILFGLGFDTATEVALLVLAGTAVVSNLPFYAILSLPVLFAAGMSLFDTLDGCFMNFAYDWAFSHPARKLYYNLTMTGLSVFVALFIGGVEVVGLLANDAHLGGPVASFVEHLNLNTAGFFVVAVFVATWLVALVWWRVGRVEERWAPPPPDAAALADASTSELTS